MREIRTNRRAESKPRDAKRAHRGAKSKAATLARKAARQGKRASQGRP